MSSDLILVVAIGPFLLSGAEVQQSLYVAGTPGPTAVAGVGHALVRRWRSSGWPEMRDRGTALLLAPMREQRGRARGMTQTMVPDPALPDEVRANFRAMLLVAVSVPDDPLSPPQGALASELAVDGWSASLVGQRAFGGVMLPLSDGLAPGIAVRIEPMDPAGAWTLVVPRRSGLMVMAGDDDVVSDEVPADSPAWMRRPLAQALRRHMLVRDKEGPWRRLVPRSGGILRPAHVGYACLGSPEQRVLGRRGDGPYPHRFVEPLLGTVVWRRPGIETLPSAFWTHHRPSDGLFLVKPGFPFANPAL